LLHAYDLQPAVSLSYANDTRNNKCQHKHGSARLAEAKTAARSEYRRIKEPAHDKQARYDADPITKDVDTRHQTHPSKWGDLRRLLEKITSVFTVPE
jgi:hypothetical protein